MADPLNEQLLDALRETEHPLLALHEEDASLPRGTGEVLVEARSAHHLLDMIGIPRGVDRESELDARTWRAAMMFLDLSERLRKIGNAHQPELDRTGVPTAFCAACSEMWPCQSYSAARWW